MSTCQTLVFLDVVPSRDVSILPIYRSIDTLLPIPPVFVSILCFRYYTGIDIAVPIYRNIELFSRYLLSDICSVMKNLLADVKNLIINDKKLLMTAGKLREYCLDALLILFAHVLCIILFISYESIIHNLIKASKLS